MKNKITEAKITNITNLEKLVGEVNGKAVAHTLTTDDIIAMANRSERRLDAAGILKKNHIGTTLYFRSGKHTHITNTGILERRAAGWYLVSFHTTSVFTSEGEYETMNLTDAGKIDAIDNIRKG